jgi:hypothetical protein
MWQLDDDSVYVRVHSFDLLEAFTYGNVRKGQRDRDKRERIRARAATGFPSSKPPGHWWAFRIYVKKSGNRPFDIENVPKLIVDAFCKWQIEDDESEYRRLWLFEDDTIDHVRIGEVAGERTSNENATRVEIFRHR